jgi:8-oxo-dGTP diphosphatase
VSESFNETLISIRHPEGDLMTQVRLVLVSACALIDGGGRVLMAKRPAKKTLGGLWEFPGGKMEPGERPEDALVRELFEELAISVRSEDLAPFAFASHSYETFHLLMPLYTCRKWTGAPQAMERQTLCWVPPEEIGTLALTPADVPLAAELCRRWQNR